MITNYPQGAQDDPKAPYNDPQGFHGASLDHVLAIGTSTDYQEQRRKAQEVCEKMDLIRERISVYAGQLTDISTFPNNAFKDAKRIHHVTRQMELLAGELEDLENSMN